MDEEITELKYAINNLIWENADANLTLEEMEFMAMDIFNIIRKKHGCKYLNDKIEEYKRIMNNGKE